MSNHTTPQNIVIFSGDTNILRYTTVDKNGVAVDLTGASAIWQLALRKTTTTLITKSTGAGIVITDAVNGILEVTLAPADTDGLAGLFVWELQITDSASQVVTAANGTARIKADQIVP